MQGRPTRSKDTLLPAIGGCLGFACPMDEGAAVACLQFLGQEAAAFITSSFRTCRHFH